nr:AAA family ATPase [Lachnospiraceae bacterium]
VHELVDQAVGGVLFIDEAYALVNPDVPNDFGMEAVDTLVKLMEDHRDDLVIIVAGYTEEMKSFLKCNTGLVSRFNKFINFPNYSNQELLEILDVMASNAGLTIEQDAKEAIGHRLEQMDPEQKEEFGNARGIRNMFEKIVMNQANRLITQSHPSREMLMTILKDDIVQD